MSWREESSQRLSHSKTTFPPLSVSLTPLKRSAEPGPARTSGITRGSTTTGSNPRRLDMASTVSGGLSGRGFSVTTGWKEWAEEQVRDAILERASSPDLPGVEARAHAAKAVLVTARAELDAVLSVALAERQKDSYLSRQLVEAQKETVVPAAEASLALVRKTVATRDPLVELAFTVAPHQVILGHVSYLQSIRESLLHLRQVAHLSGSYLRRLSALSTTGGPAVSATESGTSLAPGAVFIGHGGNRQWMALRDFLRERLHLNTDDFNRVATAGIPTADRLQEMLDNVSFALLVLTAEDETASGELNARMNVIHEVGLFQGRLGLRRAVVMLEEGCTEFSNIHGLGQIRFPADGIEAKFEEVRVTLEREGLLLGPADTSGS